MSFRLAPLGLARMLRSKGSLLVKEVTQLFDETLSLLLVEALDEFSESRNLRILVCHLETDS